MNAEVDNQIRSSWVSLDGDILICHVETRKPLNHSLSVEWTVQPAEQGTCEACPAEGEGEGDGEGTSGPGTEMHECCFDTSNWSSGPHTITLTVTDYANPGGGMSYEDRWVKDEYLFAVGGQGSTVEYSFDRNMVWPNEQQQQHQHIIVIP
jgi:hypothetical protein